jgi:hypothetical protein
MSEKPHPDGGRAPLRLCPRCRITMQAGRSNPALRDYDTFTCLSCDLVMSYGSKEATPDTASPVRSSDTK